MPTQGKRKLCALCNQRGNSQAWVWPCRLSISYLMLLKIDIAQV